MGGIFLINNLLWKKSDRTVSLWDSIKVGNMSPNFRNWNACNIISIFFGLFSACSKWRLGFSSSPVAGRSWQNCLLLVSHIFLTNVLFYTYLKGAIIHAHDKRKFAMIRKSIEWNLSLFTTLDPHLTLQKQSRLMALVYRLPETFYTRKNMLLLSIKPSQASW